MDKERLQLRRAVQQLYDMVEDTRHLAETTARGQDFRRTTLMPGESAQVMDDNEQIIARIGGSNPSGSLIEYEPQTGPDPEQPEAPELDALPGSITITASGRDVNGDSAQGNHKRVIVHTSNLPNLAEQQGTNQGEFPGPAGQYGVTTTPGIWYVALQWETVSGKLSELSEEVQVEVPRLVDSADIKTALDDAQERIDEARQEFEDGNEARKNEIENLRDTVLPGLEQSLRDAMQDLEDRVGGVDLGHLEEALDELNETRLPAIEDTLSDKADSSALGDLDTTLRKAFGEADEAVLDSAVSTLQAYARDGNNLVYNGSFEHGWDGWAVTAGELVEDEDARSGDHVLLLGRDDANECPRTSWIATEQGRLYLAEYWAKKVVEGEDPSGLRLYYQVELRDDSIDGSYGVGEGGDTELIASEDMPLGEWVKVSALVEVEQEDATQVRFAPHVRRSDYQFHIDDMRVVDVTEARAAIAYADGLPKVLHGTTAPSEDAPDGSTWFQHDGSLAGDVIGQWTRTDGEWVSTPIDSETIANLDVGKLTAGGAVLSDAVIQDLTAENGAFDRLDAREGWIGGVALQDDAVTARTVNVQELFGNTAVINEIFARVVRARLLEAEEALIGGTLLEDDAITTRHIVAETIKAAQLDVQEIFADEAVIDTIWSDVVRARLLTAEEAIIGGALLKENTIDVEHLNVTEELTAAVAQFLEITADMITANSFEGVTFTGNTFQTSDEPQRGVKMRGPENDIVAYDADGKLIMRIGDHNLNTLSGRLYTNTPGEAPGIILVEHRGPGQSTTSELGSALQFSRDGVVRPDNPQITTVDLTDPDLGDLGDAYTNLMIHGPGTDTGSAIFGRHSLSLYGPTRYDDSNVSGSTMLLTPERVVLRGDPNVGGHIDLADGYAQVIGGPSSRNASYLWLDPDTVSLSTAGESALFMTRTHTAIDGETSVSGNLFADGQLSVAGNLFADGQLQVERAAIMYGELQARDQALFEEAVDFNETIRVHAWLRNPGRPTRTSGANVFMGGSGEYLWKSTSVRRAKVNIETIPDIASRLLDLEPRVWIDRSDIEMESEEAKALIEDTPEGPRVDESKLREAMPDGELPRRVPGLVAEEVEAVGLEDFAVYETDEETGEERLQSVSYDRLWTLLIPLVREHRDKLAEQEEAIASHEETIADLQEQNSELRAQVEDMGARLARLEAMLA